jgi:site-specific recombinase XerD
MTTLSLFRNRIKVDKALELFMASREATMCTPATIDFYQRMLGPLVEWLLDRRVRTIDKVTVPIVQDFLNHVKARGVKDSTVHAYARGARAWLLWANRNGYHPERLFLPMPRVAKRKLPVLSAVEVQTVLNGCKTLRDRAIILLMVDTGLRRLETVNVNWGDLDRKTGVIQVRAGKGRKDRTVVVGNNTREVLEAYRQSVDHHHKDPLIQTAYGNRMRPTGLREVLRRLSRRTGIKLTPHTLRRTFATLSLRAGVNPMHLQGLMGHATLEQTRKYVVLIDEDLQRAHKLYGPIDRLLG